MSLPTYRELRCVWIVWVNICSKINVFALPFALNKFDPQVFGLWGKYCCAKHLMDILPNKKVVDIDLFFWSHHKFSQV
jgi:hypothetical protein